MLKHFSLLLSITLLISTCTPPATPVTPTPGLPSATLAPGATSTLASSATLTPPTFTPLAPTNTRVPTLTPTLAPTLTRTPTATLTKRPTATPIPTTRVPDFSGLGSGKIVFASQHYNPAAELSVVDLKTGRVMRLIGNLFADNLYPSLSPDGTQVAFASYFNGNFELFLLNVDERTLADFPEDLEETLEPMDWLEKLGIKQLTQTPYDEKYPAWSPDGKSLVYVEEMASKPICSSCRWRAGRRFSSLKIYT